MAVSSTEPPWDGLPKYLTPALAALRQAGSGLGRSGSCLDRQALADITRQRLPNDSAPGRPDIKTSVDSVCFFRPQATVFSLRHLRHVYIEAGLRQQRRQRERLEPIAVDLGVTVDARFAFNRLPPSLHVS